MKKLISTLSLLWLAAFSMSMAQQISYSSAQKLASNWVLTHNHYDYQLLGQHKIYDDDGKLLAYRHDLHPQGYIIVTNSMELPPVIAYSFTSDYTDQEQEINPLHEILIADLKSRFEHLLLMDESLKDQHHEMWNDILNGVGRKSSFEQWPPAGSTVSGGWLETNWKQSAPYNNFCPLDEVTGSRSIAGCPAVALAMIVNYQKNLHSTQFSDADDYFHNYAGRQYWIDDDAHVMEFLSFPEMNEYFDSISAKFLSYTPLNTDEMAALVFACGVAAKQVYTSEVSGTFGVDQAYDAYMRFAYDDAMLIYDSDTSFYTHMKNNMKDGIPVHLALLVDGAGGGHNVVTDGYNTYDYYHLNFGWGGSYNGWYLVPEEIPYNLTIVEGAIMDIGVSHVGMDQAIGNDKVEFSIYPNPSSGMFNILIDMEEPANARILVCDQKGAIIEIITEGSFNSGKSKYSWNSDLPAGIYNIIVELSNIISIKKLIINN